MDSKQAASILINPLNAPQPSEETGLNSHFRAPDSPTPRRSPSLSSNNPYRNRSSSISKDEAFTHVRQTSRSSIGSSSPTSPHLPTYRESTLGQLNDGPSKRRSVDHVRKSSEDFQGRPRRTSSLTKRYPGDESDQPLTILRRDSKRAQRSSHLRKGHIPPPDTVDKLDESSLNVPYHHEGPFDAALFARNQDAKNSPVAALEESNREALKATFPENIKDALERHRPLDGVAALPPGVPDIMGRKLKYKEGENELIEGDPAGGPYKWGGVEYSKGDLHGQGEPSYSLDRALQAHTIHERDFDGHRGIEMSDRPRDSKHLDQRDPVEIAGGDSNYSDLQYAADVDAHPVNRKGSFKAGLKKRLHAIKHKPLDEILP